MKRTGAIALLTVALLSASTGVLAQEGAVVADVPFNFTVGAKLLPAGKYTISSPSSGVVHIQNADRKLFASVVALKSNHESDGGGKLVFNRYGDQYFLHRILCRSKYHLNLDIPSSKSEKTARTREAKLQPDEQTLVAAR